MGFKYLLLILIYLLLSCKENNKIKCLLPKHKKNLTFNIKINSLVLLKPKTIDEIIKYPDTSINNFILHDPKSINNDLKPKLHYINRNDDLPYYQIFNYDSSEKLLLFTYPGSPLYEIDFFKLEYNNEKKLIKNKIILQDKHFVCSNGAFLGMDEKEFLVKYGFNKSIFKYKDSIKIYTLIIDNYSTNKFLQRHNMPVYYAKYYFYQGKIIKIEFGFEPI